MRIFGPVAASLREAIEGEWVAAGKDVDGAAAQLTLDTNSTLVVGRTRSLLGPLTGPLGPGALRGLDVVDLGCGYGAMSLLLATLGARVTGIDPHADRLEVAQAVAARHDLAARFAVGRTEALLLPDHAYDLAIINNSLCYIVDRRARRAALEQALRVLRPGGRILIRDPNRLNPRDQFTGLPLLHHLPTPAAKRAAELLGRPRSHVRLRSAAGLRRELRRAGFVDTAQLVVAPGRRAKALRVVTGYVHVTARRPAA